MNAGRMRRRALDNPGYKGAALIVGLGEHANAWIGYLPPGEDPLKTAMLEREDENIRKLVIGWILRRVIMGVGGAELRQHRVDRHRRFVSRAPGYCVRAEAGPLLLPVDSIQAAIVEAVTHQFPEIIEVRLI